MKLPLILVCAASTALFALPQVRDAAPAPSSGSGQISGRVVTDEAAASPVRRVTMILTGDRASARAVAVTDDAGQFAFTNLPADRYSLSAAKAGYLPWKYGSKRPGGSGTPIVIADGQRLVVAMTLIKGSVLTGTVRDEHGAPMPDVMVSALRYAVSSQSGERELQSVKIGSAQPRNNYMADDWPGTATSDDRGMYRIFGLAPGDYIVSASVRPALVSLSAAFDIHQVSRADVQRAQQLLHAPGSASPIGPPAATDASSRSRVDYAPVYYPAAITSADATVVTLIRSEERSGVDIMIRLVPTATLKGVLTRPDGTPVSAGYLNLRQVESESTGNGGVRLARSSDDGTFSIAGLSPGRYELLGYTYPDGLSAIAPLEIAGRDLSTSLVLLPGGTVSGRLVFDGASKTSAPTSIQLMVWPRPLAVGTSKMARDGTFVMSNIPPGKYQIRIIGRPPAGWIVQSALVRGADALDIPFEIASNQNIDDAVVTLSDRGAEVSGKFVDKAGNPAPGYMLVIFSADRRRCVPRSNRTQLVRPDAAGTFVARDLPAGDYLISAVSDIDDGEWNDPSFLASLAAASPVKVTLAAGDKKVQDIRVGGG